MNSSDINEEDTTCSDLGSYRCLSHESLVLSPLLSPCVYRGGVNILQGTSQLNIVSC